MTRNVLWNEEGKGAHTFSQTGMMMMIIIMTMMMTMKRTRCSNHLRHFI